MLVPWFLMCIWEYVELEKIDDRNVFMHALLISGLIYIFCPIPLFVLRDFGNFISAPSQTTFDALFSFYLLGTAGIYITVLCFCNAMKAKEEKHRRIEETESLKKSMMRLDRKARMFEKKASFPENFHPPQDSRNN